MSRIGDWWRLLLGRSGKPVTPIPPSTARTTARQKPAPDDSGELTLAKGPPSSRKPSRVGAAGFDPYSSDGGYAKPGRWDRLDHD
jgi:hypothetical protein